MSLELHAKASVIRRKHSADVLRIELLGLSGESHEVDENDGDSFSFLEGTLVSLE